MRLHLQFSGALLIALCSFTFNSFAQTPVSSTKSGDYNDPTTWSCTCIPNAADVDLTITHAINFYSPASVTVNSLTINTATGDLAVNGPSISVTGSVSINAGQLVINGGTVTVGADVTVTDSDASNIVDVGVNDDGVLTVGGDLILTSGDSDATNVYVEANGTALITVNGDIDFNAAAGSVNQKRDQNLINLNNSATLDLNGNVMDVQDGHFLFFNNSTLALTGTAPQSLVSLRNNWEDFPNLVIDNPAGITLTPTNYDPGWGGGVAQWFNFNVRNSLNLINGTLNTGQSKPACGAAMYFNIGTNATIAFANGGVEGAFAKTGTAAFSVPLVDGGLESILTIGPITGGGTSQHFNISGSGTSTTFRIDYSSTDPGNNLLTTGGIDHVSAGESWDISTCGTAPTSSSVSFGWADACESDITDVTSAAQDLVIAQWGSGAWNNLGGTIAPGSLACDPGGVVETGSLTINGVSTFGVFTFGSESNKNALPIELIGFSAITNEKGVLLSWETATEINSDRFEIEWSADGRNFSLVGTVAAKGSTDQRRQQYYYADNTFQQGKNYYRLKLLDIDGSFVYSKIVFADMKENSIMTYPNPGRVNDVIHLNRKSDFQILNSQGIAIREFEDSNSFDTEGMVPGIYYLRAGEENLKILIK